MRGFIQKGVDIIYCIGKITLFKVKYWQSNKNFSPLSNFMIIDLSLVLKYKAVAFIEGNLLIKQFFSSNTSISTSPIYVKT